ncbi:unnamed protein product, partial [marine sediment metagenome]
MSTESTAVKIVTYTDRQNTDGFSGAKEHDLYCG